MKNKLFLTTLLALGFTAASQAQNTTTFVDVATLGVGIVDSFTGGARSNGSEAKVISVDQRWTRDKVYLITQNIMIKSGVVLTIEPGTLVRFEKNVRAGVNSLNPADPGALVVAGGARLIANGTAEAPIIFTSIDDPNVPGGEWTIPPYENKAEYLHTTYAASYRKLRDGYEVRKGTDGVGEFTITNAGTFRPAPEGPRNYSTAVAQNGMWDQTGLWGGIVWLGRANIVGDGFASGENARSMTAAAGATGAGKGLYAAEGLAEFTNYATGGGDTDSDDQGVVRFLSNRYGGFEVIKDKELNAFSMYGVGYNTVVEFVEDWCNKDDSFEFWGGCNTVKYAVSAFCGDDGIDTDTGWVGNIQFVVQIQNPADDATGAIATSRLNVDSGDNLSENDGPEGSGAFPKTVGTIANCTFIGRGYGARGLESADRVGVEVKSGGSLKLINNVFMDAPFGAMSLSGTASQYINTTGSGTGYDGSGTKITGVADTSNGFPYGEIRGNVWYRCGLAVKSGSATTVNAGSFVVGTRYRIKATGDTSWTSIGAPVGATAGTVFTATGVGSGTGTADIDNLTQTYADINAATKFATRSQMFRASTARASNGASDEQIESIFGSAITTPNLSTTGSTALLNGNYVNLDPGFDVPLSGRIDQGCLAFTPTSTIVKDSGVTIDRTRAPQLADLTAAPHIGAVRDNAWYLTWTMLGLSGLMDSRDESIEPVVTVTKNGSNARVSFASLANKKYSVERSTDNKKFESIAIVPGNSDSSVINYDDTVSAGAVNSTPKFYRVLCL
jgi:hypothetical protein